MKNLITAHELASLHGAVILDARFRLQDPSAAERLFLEGHIPGAQRVDIDRDLSCEKSGKNGRHPLPSRAALGALFSKLGIGNDTWVVVYDDSDHSGAARLWYMLRWLGHDKVRVLHGGLKAWAKGFVLARGPRAERPLSKAEFRERVALVKLQNWSSATNLVDARAPERFRGEVEPLDPVAGHIPGAKNLPYTSVLEDGKFLPVVELRQKLLSLGPHPTFYCGSGITSAVLLLAAEEAGIEASLYPGSWSEYCAQSGARVERG
jgi:thiosulfate/3-mercaptopyruvate sulfurtransferase